MTENKRFWILNTLTKCSGIKDKNKLLTFDEVVVLLNELSEENEQLKKQKEFWKSDACSLSNINSILSNELSIAQEQGYEPSKPYKEYIASIKTEYDKFWKRKLNKAKIDGVINEWEG